MNLFVSLVYICTAVGDPVIKRGGLGSSYQEGSVGIQLSRGEGWRSSHQEGRVGDPVIKRGVLGTKWINPSTLCVPDRNRNLDFQRQGER